jgi:alpha-tubulin suppressor-like RCC1 family protein
MSFYYNGKNISHHEADGDEGDNNIITDIGKVKRFPTRQSTDIIYPYMMVGLTDGSLLGWGRTYNQALGINETSDTVVTARKPIFNIPVPAGVTVKDFVICSASAWALLSNGWVYSAGLNGYGQLGHGDTTARPVFTRIEYFVTNGIAVDKIFCGGSREHSALASAFFVAGNGDIYACGYNGYGQLGVGDTAQRTIPTRISGAFSNVVDIVVAAATQAHVFLRTANGDVYASGRNGHGQLGLGDTTNRSAFTKVPNVADVAEVVCTTYSAGYSLIRLADGDVYACGYNNYGQLGQGDTASRSAFTKIAELSNVVSIGCEGGNAGYSWAISDAGRFYTWGCNSQGAIGDGTTTHRKTPFDVVGWSGGTTQDPPFVGKIHKVAAHPDTHDTYQHLIVLDTDGKLWFAGYDYSYYSGSAAAYRKLFTPIPLPALDSPEEKIVDLFAHGYDGVYRLFLLSDADKLYALGENGHGICQAGHGVYSDYDNGLTSLPGFVKSPIRVPI